MLIQKIALNQFRNFEKKEMSFDFSNIIVGDNTRGKTNILEAVFYLATGKSFRAEKENEVIKEGQEFVNIEGSVFCGDEEKKLRVFLSNHFERPRMKRLEVNGVNRVRTNFAGHLKAVLFTPENFNILNGSPSIRRKYLNSVVMQTDRTYLKTLNQYKKIVYQRNRLLERISERRSKRDELEYWNNKLLELGQFIQKRRMEFFNFLSQSLEKYSFLFKSGKILTIDYKSNLINQERLNSYVEREIGARVTLIGPHRDDFIMFLGNKKLSLFGSRGEQRLGVLILSLLSLDYIEHHVKVRPLLLLDDVFSELDQFHKKAILNILETQQTIMTTTDWDFDLPKIKKITL